jgi:hypothetical protein
MGFISQLIASGVGGAIGGSFVLWGVKAQFRSQCEAAIRALVVEVDGNASAAMEMTQARSYPPPGRFEQGHADPGWLKHAVWDSQLPHIVKDLDEGALIAVVKAYATLDTVPAMALPSTNPPKYIRGGWIDDHLIKIQTAFSEAQRALRLHQERATSERWVDRARSSLDDLRKRIHRELGRK